jgi:hypothetical protein
MDELKTELFRPELITPTDAQILQIIIHFPELSNNNYIKRRYNSIIKVLDGQTMTNDNITINNTSKRLKVFGSSYNPILSA